MNGHFFRVALVGNPNCGKTSIFNALTGTRQHVGNYPGVTVESKKGYFTLDDNEIELVDLPGVYSLSSGSPEEEVVFHELMQPGIDLILNVIDSTIPQRHLYLTTQIAELHIPMLLAFNMSDDAKKKGLNYDFPKLEKYFGSPIVQTVGSSADGVKNLISRLNKTLSELENHGVPMLSYGADIDDAIEAVSVEVEKVRPDIYRHIPSRFFAIKLLENDRTISNMDVFRPVVSEVEKQIQHLWTVHAIQADTFMADCRYAMLAGACRDTISMSHARRREISDKIDLIMTNRYLGLPLFLLILYITFWLTFTCARPFVDVIDAFFTFINDAIRDSWSEDTFPILRDLLTIGIIKGVGGVLVFLPNILFLFFAISILEDSGYMSRAAFVMDGIMRTFGLQGRSFVPLVLGFGCNVPAVMATRVIESDRDRKITILVLPLMSCGARLPIYAMIIPVFFQRYQATVMFLVYLIGIVIALIAARIMKSTIFNGDGDIYLMELPPYRMPTIKSLMLHMWDRGKSYLKKAGTIILATSIVLYICNTFPIKHAGDFSPEAAEKIALSSQTELNDEQIQKISDSEYVRFLQKTDGSFAELAENIRKTRTVPERERKIFQAVQSLTDEEIAIINLARKDNHLTEAQINVILNSEALELLPHAQEDKEYLNSNIAELRKNASFPPDLLEIFATLADMHALPLDYQQNQILEAAGTHNRYAVAAAKAVNAERMEYAVSGRIGKFLEPMFKPIGFDWKLTTASLAALSAKEIFVSQLGILYGDTGTLRENLRKNYTPLQAFCIMLFSLLSIPCFATLVVMYRELNSWKLTFAGAFGLFIVSYLLSLIVFQLGTFFHFGVKFLS